jgi:chromosome segregation ATPase
VPVSTVLQAPLQALTTDDIKAAVKEYVTENIKTIVSDIHDHTMGEWHRYLDALPGGVKKHQELAVDAISHGLKQQLKMWCEDAEAKAERQTLTVRKIGEIATRLMSPGESNDISNAFGELRSTIRFIRGDIGTLERGQDAMEDKVNDVAGDLVTHFSELSARIEGVDKSRATDFTRLNAYIKSVDDARMEDFKTLSNRITSVDEMRATNMNTAMSYTTQSKTWAAREIQVQNNHSLDDHTKLKAEVDRLNSQLHQKIGEVAELRRDRDYLWRAVDALNRGYRVALPYRPMSMA